MIQVKSFENGFKYIEVTNDIASAKIALQGAHIYEYKCKGKDDILWLSETSSFEDGTAIRGGIPICWPRFGSLDESLPAHGFSRTSKFELLGAQEISRTLTEVTLLLKDTKESRALWDVAFELEVIFRVGETLKVEMKTINRDKKEFMITQALHTYFSVSSIADVKIFGLEEKPFLDTLKDEESSEKKEISIDAECDRVYQDVDRDIVLKDKNRTIILKAEGSSSAIVWNPWIEKGSRMSGMRADAYREFVCIETANAFNDFRLIKPQESHTLSVILSS